MSAKRRNSEPSEPQAEYVPAVYARSREQAELYRDLLNDHEIPAVLGDADEDADEADARRPRTKRLSRGLPVLVPDSMLDEASEIIADRDEVEQYRIDAEEDAEEDEEDEFGVETLEVEPAVEGDEGLEDDEDEDDDEEDEEDEDDEIEDEEDDDLDDDVDDEPSEDADSGGKVGEKPF